MRLTARRLKREIVAIVLIAGAALTYLSLQGTRWDVYVTLCVAYTILIVGMAWANGKWKLYFGDGRNSLRSFAQVHLGFMLSVLLLMWAAMLFQPSMPEWLISQGGDKWSWYHVVVMLMVVGVVLIEQWWIEKRQRRHPN